MQSVARIDLGIKLPYYLNSSFLDFFWVKNRLISYLVTNITKKSNLSQTKNRKSYQSYHHNAQIFFGKLQILARIEPCLPVGIITHQSHISKVSERGLTHSLTNITSIASGDAKISSYFKNQPFLLSQIEENAFFVFFGWFSLRPTFLFILKPILAPRNESRYHRGCV